MSTKTLLVIVGPTAIGKTDLAIILAKRYQTEILSADSRQFYQEMSIGTAKPSAEELAAVKHHFIDSLSITENYTVGDFEKEALAVLDSIFLNRDVAVLAGGSGLFVNAVCTGFDEFPRATPAIRDRLNTQFAEEGIEALQRRLQQVDPLYYEEVDKENPQRLIRALEVYEVSGKPFSSYRTKQPLERPFKIIKIGLNADRELLYQRINDRVDKMIKTGLVAEAENLFPFKHLNALNTVGYSELFDYFDGKIALEEAIQLIKQNTRRFAKRQLTWFRRDQEIKWFEPGEYQDILQYLEIQTG